MPLLRFTCDEHSLLVNTDHILAVRPRTDEDGSEYCEIEMQNTDSIPVNETLAEIEAIAKAAS